MKKIEKTYVFINSKTETEKIINAVSEKEAGKKLLNSLPDKGTIDNWKLHSSQG